MVVGMNRTASLLAVFALLLPPACKHKETAPAPAASNAAARSTSVAVPPEVSDFEGAITLVGKGKFASSDSAPTNLTVLVKAGKFRIDVPEALTATRGLGQGYLLALPAEKKLYAVLDAKKQAVLIELDKVAQQAEALGARSRTKSGAADAPAARLEQTGKVDTVASTQCEIWRYEREKTAAEVCIAEQDTPWFQLPVAGVPGDLAWASQITDGKHLPLRFISLEQGEERGRVEVTSIVKKTLSASSFELPTDYAVLTLEQVMGGMLGRLGTLGASGVNLPPGVKLPAGVKLPPGLKLPPSVAMPPNPASK